MTLPTHIEDLEKQKFVDVSPGVTAVKTASASGAAPATEATLAAASAKLPATLGQKAMAASMAIAVASNQSDVPANIFGNLATEPPRKTFSASAVFAAADTPTDVFELYGPSSGAIYITKISFSGNKTTGTNETVIFLRRSTANTSGTPVSVTCVPHKTGDTTTASCNYYTANPTTGTLVGNIYCERHFMSATSTFSPPVIWEAGMFNKPLVLSSASEGICINLDGVTRTGNSVVCTIEFFSI
jgi:hypothetical protein